MRGIIVVDASAVLEALLDADRHPWITEAVADEACRLLVPHLCDVEVVSALRRVTGRAGTPELAESVLRVYLALPLERLPHLPLLERILELRDNFSAYDAAYVALAEATEAPLYTADARLARAIGEHTEVDVVEV